MVVAKIAAIDSSTMTHSGSAAEDVAAILSLARGHLVGDVHHQWRCSRVCLMVRESGDPRSHVLSRDASSGCSNAARREERAKLGSGVWASSLPIPRGSIRRTHQDQAGCVDGVTRCRSMDPRDPSSSLGWPETLNKTSQLNRQQSRLRRVLHFMNSKNKLMGFSTPRMLHT